MRWKPPGARRIRIALRAALAMAATALSGIVPGLMVTAGLLGAAPAVAQVPPSGAPGDRADIDNALDLYRYRLLFTGTKLRAYPAEAMEKRLTGQTMVALRFGTDGKLQSLEIVQSSGAKILDDYALELLQAAVPLTEIPSPLHNTAFNLRVAVVFALPP